MDKTRRAVLEAVADGPTPGPAIAAELDCSRTAVWKHVEHLRDAGFEIDSTEAGYELRSIPEYGEIAVAYGLDAPFSIEYHDSLPSTNERARELAAAGEVDVAVLAEQQTAGRGRLDRTWASPPGGIWLSVLLRPSLLPAEAPILTLAAAVALARAVEPTGLDVELKWPNDVLAAADERKLAGILTEMTGEPDGVEWVIIGVGVNANVSIDLLPSGATSLRERVGDVDRRGIVQRFLRALHELRNDTELILPAWRERSATLGRRVRIGTADGSIEGTAVGVEPPGHLIVETDAGRERVTAGDCEHLRPADS